MQSNARSVSDDLQRSGDDPLHAYSAFSIRYAPHRQRSRSSLYNADIEDSLAACQLVCTLIAQRPLNDGMSLRSLLRRLRNELKVSYASSKK